ncbi:MAG: dockerin type I repeat-containing protein [Candidatus Marinimicrobia bacterium]|nr:dockerin type I repeat-containing protein [Candidatus Neomarinimicrobiota bacterium]
MIRYLTIIMMYFLPFILVAENEVCYDILPNPHPNDPALSGFSKYIHVLNCFHIYGESQISDSKMLHAAAVASELLDNNEDGVVDDPIIENTLRNSQAMMPIFTSEWSSIMDDVEDYYDGCISAALFRNEIDPTQPGHWGDDATVEEILHTINHCGHVEIYPSAFSLQPNSSQMSDAMDIARGGQFLSVPNQYPEEAWYHYDDWTCDYECMAIEYMYWAIVSNMGILDDPQTCNGIDNEWELCTPELFASTDLAMYALIINPQYKLPLNAPDGNYCPADSLQGDLNGDGYVNIQDIIILVNYILFGDGDINGDLNGDEGVNILDIVVIVQLILGS